MKKCKLRQKNNCINNKGMTLIEMIVSFALLAIFLVSAAAIIGTMTSMYFEIKRENYSRQVTDIILEKVESEIDGAEYKKEAVSENLRIQSSTGADTGGSLDTGDTIILSDKTGTKVKVYADSGELIVYYYPIGDSYSATNWKFDKSVYNSFKVEELLFVKGDKISGFGRAAEFGLTNPGTYGKDIVVVFLKVHSPEYGDYYAYRFVKMYNYTGS